MEFADILIRSSLPLHPDLLDHPRLSIRAIADDNFFWETPPVNGDPESGLWDLQSPLHVSKVRKALTFVLVSHRGRIKIRFATTTLSIEELVARVQKQPHGYHEFPIDKPGSSMQLLMTCSVKLVASSTTDTYPSQTVTHPNHTADRSGSGYEETTKSQPERAGSRLPSRERLQSSYAMICGWSQDDKACGLSLQGSAYNALYNESGDKADLDKSISIHEEAMRFTSDSHPQLAEHSNRLGVALADRFIQSGDVADIGRAVRLHQNALALTDDGDPERLSRLGSFGNALQFRFELFGDLADLETAISCQQQAVNLQRDDDPGKLTTLNNLGNALQARFERLGSLTDIDDAISRLQKAVELTPDGHPDKPSRLNNLGNALYTRFERLGSLTDIDDAISRLQKAVELTPDGHPDKPSRLNNLGNALHTRFKWLGSLTDIDDAISRLQKAVELTPDGHPDNSSRLNNLGNALYTRFERLGSLTDIHDAISRLQKAVELTPDRHPDNSSRLNNLGNALHTRFERLGSLTDIDDAISRLQKAVELTPDGHPDNPSRLNNLGNALHTRFKRLGSLTDIDDAISRLQKAIELTPDGHPDKPSRLNNLGNALYTRFERLGSLTDIDDAISRLQKAVELTPDGHPDNPSRLNNLGNALHTRFERLGSLTDIDDAISSLTDIAISRLQRAVELTPDGHSDKPSQLNNLGNALALRFVRSDPPKDLESALQNYSEAATSPTGPAMVRFTAACMWARIEKKYSLFSLSSYRCAIDLLPRIAWLGLAVTDQHSLLADIGHIVRDAVEAAICFEEYETAVEWAEQGRSIVWQNLLGLRTPLDDLRAAYPQLANRLQLVTSQLEASSPPGAVSDRNGVVSITGVARKSSELATEWEDIVEEIRQLPKFERFLKAKTFTELAPAAYEGPIVILNVHQSRCDALVLILDDSEERHVSVINIPLEHFSEERSETLLQDLKRLLSSAGVRDGDTRKHEWVRPTANGESKFKNILRILWLDVVKPVMDGLACRVQSGTGIPPRIWWCATGSLAFLPIHAAGLYDAGGVGDNVSDYAVSSYTPTLMAILQPAAPIAPGNFQVLTVSQPSTPYAAPIPKTENEVRVVQRLAKGVRIVNLGSENAIVQRVLQGMAESSWIHLACHGQQRVDDPTQSGFLLHDRVLKLSEIVKASLPKAEFAFLSACQTAMGDEKVSEGSVHLAAGMLFSGCHGVIATMWSIRDDDVPQIAENVYGRILKDGRPNRKEAAYALHEAVKRLRESGADSVAWVPFIHIGR